jgi:hypothetical protein
MHSLSIFRLHPCKTVAHARCRKTAFVCPVGSSHNAQKESSREPEVHRSMCVVSFHVSFLMAHIGFSFLHLHFWFSYNRLNPRCVV